MCECVLAHIQHVHVKKNWWQGVNRNGTFVCVVRFVIGRSGPHQSLPELVICMGLIDNKLCKAGTSVILYDGRENAENPAFFIAITFLLSSIKSLLLRKWLKLNFHKGISTLHSHGPSAGVFDFILAD